MNFAKSMKPWHCAMIGLSLAAFLQASEPAAKVTFILGKAEYRKTGRRNWEPLQQNASVRAGDFIRTRSESRCEITYPSNRVVRINENSTVELPKMPEIPEDVILHQGRLWLNVFKPRKPKRHRVLTPTVISTIRGTVVDYDCDAIRTDLRVFSGQVSVTRRTTVAKPATDSALQVTAGQLLRVVSDYEKYKQRTKREFDDYKKEKRDEMDKFKQEKQMELNEYRERKGMEMRPGRNVDSAFQRWEDFHYSLQRFDQRKAKKKDWVRWNLARDLELPK